MKGAMTTANEGQSLLQRLAEANFPIQVLYDAGSGPLAKLVLGSAEIERRASEHWQYKNLAHFGEEQFVSLNPVHYLLGKHSDWHKYATAVFAESVYRSIWHEERGLLLYVDDGQGAYRKAKAGDSAYDFVCRLRNEQMLSGLEFSETPQWAKELFLYRSNYDAYCLLWGDPDSLSDPDAVRLKREAVLRETDRHGKSGEARARLEPPIFIKDLVRLLDVAKAFVATDGITASEASNHVIDLLYNDNPRVWLIHGNRSEGPEFVNETRGRNWVLSLNESCWWENDRPFRTLANDLVEAVAVTRLDAERLFDGHVPDLQAPPVLAAATCPSEIDPSDRPDELDCANVAFRAVSSGYGEKFDTFRNRLLAWIAEHRADLGSPARERIATVANPDKSVGRQARKPK